MNKPEIVISTQDFDLISDLLDKKRSSTEHLKLTEEIDRATIVDKKELPENVVSINSTVSFIIEATKKEFTYKLVAPKADLRSTEISILSPIGTAIFGLTVGQTIEWPMSAGKAVAVRIIDVAASLVATKNT
jgi:regulator of nucleoside diphosphate kinase